MFTDLNFLCVWIRLHPANCPLRTRAPRRRWGMCLPRDSSPTPPGNPCCADFRPTRRAVSPWAQPWCRGEAQRAAEPTCAHKAL